MASSDQLRRRRDRPRGRPDAEHAQAFVRFLIVSAAVAYLHLIDPSVAAGAAGNLLVGRRIALVSLLASLVFVVSVWLWPRPAFARRISGICHDIAFLSGAMYLGESGSAPFAALYLVIILGNGFRYGTRYLYFSAAVALGSFAIVFLNSDYWISQSILSTNIFLMLAVVPFYTGRLLTSLQTAKDQLEVQATRDALTGLLSRTEFETAVQAAMRQSADDHVLLFCDLDFFKQVNDAAGHAAGDKLLTDIGAIISHSVRVSDICGRPGGDEFSVLLVHCSLEKAREIAEQIRSRVAGYRLAWGMQYYSVGISIGAAPTSAVRDMNSLLRLADAACYAAKNAGRNQIHVVDPRVDDVDTAEIRRLFAGRREASFDSAANEGSASAGSSDRIR